MEARAVPSEEVYHNLKAVIKKKYGQALGGESPGRCLASPRLADALRTRATWAMKALGLCAAALFSALL